MSATTRTTSQEISDLFSRENLSVWLISIATIAALLFGWFLKTSVEDQTKPMEHAGVQANFPEDWIVEKGFEGESLVFYASDPLNRHQHYIINLIDTPEHLDVNDVVFNRNLNRAQQLNTYKVLEQTPVRFQGKEAFKLHFAYIQPNGKNQLPSVIEGVEYFFSGTSKTLLVTLEEETDDFDALLPEFWNFLSTVSYSEGGGE